MSDLATVTVLRPRTIPEESVTTIQRAIEALTELDGDLTSGNVGDTLRAVLGDDQPNGHREHTGDLLVGLLGFAELLLQDLADELGTTPGALLGTYASLNGGDA